MTGGETIIAKTAPVVDRYGDVVQPAGEREIHGCVVGLQGQSDINGGGVWDGDATTLEVLAPPGTVVEEGAVIICRGLEYTVSHVPFDWSVGRRPVNARHRPRVRFLIDRGEA